MEFDLEQFVDDLSVLVGLRTEVCRNPGEFRRANEFLVEHLLGDVEVDVEEYAQGEQTSLLIRRRGSPRPALLVDCHVEVVPAPDEGFRLRREDDRLIGRGTIDMKTQLLAVVWALRRRLQAGHDDDTWVLVSQDEEVGSRAGAQVVRDDLEERDLLPPVAFVPDGGPDFTAVAAEKGIVQARLEARGTGTHGSRPWLADNPIDTVLSVRQRLVEVWPEPTDEQDWRTSVALTGIAAGGADNRVPDRATAQLDIRHPADVDGERVQATVAEVAEEHGVTAEFTNIAVASTYPHDGEVGRRWLDALAEAAGRDEAPRVRTAGASNGRFWSDAGATVLMTNPTGGNAHAAGEWVAIDAIEPYVRLVDTTLNIANQR